MSVEPKFVDTNVLVYLFDADSSKKQARARDLLREERDRLIVSVQVLGEFFVTVTRKLAVRCPPMRRVERSMRFASSRSRLSIPGWCEPRCVEVGCRVCRTGTR